MSGVMQAPRILSSAECESLGRRLLEMVDTPKAAVSFQSSASASSSFAQGRARVPLENETANVTLYVDIDNARGAAVTNQLDDESLAALVREAQAAAREHRTPTHVEFLAPESYPQAPQTYFESIADGMGAEHQAEILDAVMRATAEADLLGAGDLRLAAQSRATLNSRGMWAFEQSTFGDFSLTARTRDGTGSGWAWSGYEDWSRVNIDDVVLRATNLARRSANPVAVEPGRYPVILEPAAVAALIQPILSFWSARWADAGATIFSGEVEGQNKIGEQMLDRRIGMVSDPWDPERPGSVMTRQWTPIPEPVVWFEGGVLKNLEYDRQYVQFTGGDVVIAPTGVRVTVDDVAQSLDEMVASTRRGIWVNRLSNITFMNAKTLLLSGTTRDGTFLIEDGRITRSVKNFRFTESPFFALNRLEGAGVPVRASQSIIAPRLKLGDFNFTSLTDAI